MEFKKEHREKELAREVEKWQKQDCADAF